MAFAKKSRLGLSVILLTMQYAGCRAAFNSDTWGQGPNVCNTAVFQIPHPKMALIIHAFLSGFSVSFFSTSSPSMHVKNDSCFRPFPRPLFLISAHSFNHTNHFLAMSYIYSIPSLIQASFTNIVFFG